MTANPRPILAGWANPMETPEPKRTLRSLTQFYYLMCKTLALTPGLAARTLAYWSCVDLKTPAVLVQVAACEAHHAGPDKGGPDPDEGGRGRRLAARYLRQARAIVRAEG